MDAALQLLIRHTVDELDSTEDKSLTADFTGFRRRAEQAADLLLAALFPGAAGEPLAREQALIRAAGLLQDCLEQVLAGSPRPEEALSVLLRSLPRLRKQLEGDLMAAYRGDPAALSPGEVLLCYPGFRAVAIYRLAHVLYREGVPLLPRVMTEYAHRLTGIDIHPGAEIGDSFFIDHGTGVVIGETTTIGENVKLYQHVTLGARSFEAAPDGTPVKGVKRHPDVGDRVVIYAGATVLGGKTRIGSDSIIGGSVWLTRSVPAGKLVQARAAVTDRPLERDLSGDDPENSAML